LAVFRRWSDQKSIAEVKRKIAAHLLEFRLFMDEPRVVLRSQAALLVENARLLRLLVPPLLIMAVPIAALMWQLDALYSRAPLRVGEAAVVSTDSPQRAITVPDGVRVETETIYLPSAGDSCWRIRPVRAVSGTARVAELQARIVAGSGIAYLPDPIASRHRLEITYPHASVFGLHWVVWFFVLSTIAAFILRRPLRVVI
jgi:hypothetical protein